MGRTGQLLRPPKPVDRRYPGFRRRGCPQWALVNAVSPGFIETDMTKGLAKAEILKMVPLRRFGTAAEVAGAVAFLCSDDATYITGHVINVNGGIYM